MTSKTVLIVDDEAAIREMIAVALQIAGYDCLEAEMHKQHTLLSLTINRTLFYSTG